MKRNNKDKLIKTLQRLSEAADAYRADQSYANDPRCGLVQPIDVKEGKELNAALDEAWDLLDDI